MNKVILDESLNCKLNGTDQEVELVDERGETVGFFVPSVDLARLKQLASEEQRRLNRWGFSQLTQEQIDVSVQDNELFTIEEVIKHLESL